MSAKFMNRPGEMLKRNLNPIKRLLVPLLAAFLLSACFLTRGAWESLGGVKEVVSVKPLSPYEVTRNDFVDSGVGEGAIIVETGEEDGPLLEPIEEYSEEEVFDEESFLDPIDEDTVSYEAGDYPYTDSEGNQEKWLVDIDQGSLMRPLDDVDLLENRKKTALFVGDRNYDEGRALLDDDERALLDEEELEEESFSEKDKVLEEKLLQDLKKEQAELFPVTEGLKGMVQFWTDIYGHYTSDRIVIHNKRHPEIIYTVIEASDYKIRNYSYRRVLKLRRKKVKEAKRKYKKILRKLASHKRINPAELEGEECRIYDLFLHIDDKNKFKEAARFSQIRAQVGQKDRFLKALEFSGLYRERMERIFQENGLPVELTRLPFVESAFNTRAYSPAGAAGIWQFIYSTGKLFMKIDSLVDERRDPYKSTLAAAKLLKLNYDQLKSWPLAVSAYNHGNVGIQRAVAAMNTDDMGVIAQGYKGRRFGFASRNYYAQFLAANYVFEHAKEIFGQMNFRKPLTYDKVVLDSFISSKTIIKHCHLSVEDFKEYNPELRASVFRYSRLLPKGYHLKLPPGSKDKFMRYYATASKMKVFKMAGYHQVEPGDTLSGIARMYGTKIRYLILINALNNENMIRIGQKLKIPVAGYKGKVKLASRSASKLKKVKVKRKAPVRKADSFRGEDEDFVKHRVRRGESLIYLARRYSVSVGDLRRYNSIGRKSRIYVGQILSVPVSSSYRQDRKVALNEAGSDDMIDNPAGYNGDYLRILVQKGDSLWRLAKEYGTTVRKLKKANNITGHGLRFGDELRIPVADRTEAKNKKKGTVKGSRRTSSFGTIYVLPNESIGHLARWSKTSKRAIRGLNHFSSKAEVHEGQAVKIDYRKTSAVEFHKKRKLFQRGIKDRYLKKYKIAKLKDHILKKNQNVWNLCRKVYKIPYWLVKKYNYGKNLARLKVGDSIVVPIVTRRSRIAKVL
ncbi:MAG: LysM peptidoglycan-binding domain-containing protein [bacterium]